MSIVEDWACALAAPIRQRTKLPLQGLAAGVGPVNGKGSRFCKEQLRGIASIHDRGDVREQLESYLARGAREEYAKVQRWHDALPPEARTIGFYLLDQTDRLKRVFVHDHRGRPEEVSSAAWDVARIAHYASLAYGAAYIDEDEAWRYLARAGRLALDTYDSWEAYGRGFVYGRWFWQGYWDAGMKETDAVVNDLVKGYLRSLPWPIDLAPLERRASPKEDVKAPPNAPLTCTALRLFSDCASCLTPILLREPDLASSCDVCGEPDEKAMHQAWSFALARDDDEDEDEEDEEEEEEEGPGPHRFTNLGDQTQRAIKWDPATLACAACHEPIPLGSLSDGDVTCACGHRTRVVVAPAFMREINPHLRFVVGGPLTTGRPDDVLTFVFEQVGS